MGRESGKQNKRELPGSGRSVHGYILTYSREYLSALGYEQWGGKSFIFYVRSTPMESVYNRNVTLSGMVSLVEYKSATRQCY